MWVVRLVLFLLCAFIVIVVAAFVYLPWWQALLVIAWTMLTMWFAGKLAIRYWLSRVEKIARGLFRTKSEVLQGAELLVHGVTLAPSPPRNYAPPNYGNGLPMENLLWYQLDFTIVPKPAASAMNHWDVDDLRFVPFDAPTSEQFEEDRTEGRELWDVQLEVNGAFRELPGSKLEGRHRLRCLVGLPPEVSEVKLRYYFEHFGSVRLPVVLSGEVQAQ